MATVVSYQAKYIAAVYDNQGTNKESFHEIASTENSMIWNKSRFPDLESRSSAGLRVNTYINELSTPDTLSSGLLKNEDDGKWLGAKRSGGDAKFYPLFHEGQFQYKDNWYTLVSERTIQEAANLSSVVDTDETAFRHVFSKIPLPEYGVRSTIFKREIDSVDRPFIDFQLVDEFTPYAGHDSTIYHKGGYIDWSVVDNTVPECMLDSVQGNDTELVFNQDLTDMPSAVPYYTPASLNDRLPYLSTCLTGTGTNTFLTEYYPVRESTFNFYTYDGINVVQWTGTDTFASSGPSDLHYKINPSLGEIITNPDLTTFPGEPLAEFESLPLIEYRMNCNQGNYYSAQEASLARLVTNVDRGSVIYALRDPEVFENLAITVNIDSLSTVDNDTWTDSFYGDTYHKMIFTVTDNGTGDTVAGVPLRISLESGIGQLLGIDSDTVLYTDENGEAFSYFLPPMLGESIGIKDVTRGTTTTELELTGGLTEHFFENIPSEIYVYGIYKDDPLLGRLDPYPGAASPNAEGTVVWDSDAKNGRKRILYKFNEDAVHPIYGTLGAFEPIRPIYVTGDKLVFQDPLPLDNATDTANNLGGFFVAGPRRTNFSVQIDLDLLGIGRFSTVKSNFNIITGLSSFAKGDYVLTNTVYPFGWRLPGSIKPSSQLGGALYLTINPIAGTADILFESGEQYKHFTSELVLQVNVIDT